MEEVEEKQQQQSSKPKEERKLMTDRQKGLVSLGMVAGAAYGISKKKNFWGILGCLWLGGIAGGGLGYLFKKKED